LCNGIDSPIPIFDSAFLARFSFAGHRAECTKGWGMFESFGSNALCVVMCPENIGRSDNAMMNG